MRYVGRIRLLLVVLVLGTAPVTLGACGGVSCSQTAPGPETTFVGRVVAIHDAAVDFAVESVHVDTGAIADPHPPAVGTAVTVGYVGGDERFLRVGGRYRVVVHSGGGRLQSDVHRAGDCGTGGTVHADGTPIDTANVSWMRVHRAVLALALAPLVVLALLGTWLGYRRRRTRTVRVDDRYL